MAIFLRSVPCHHKGGGPSPRACDFLQAVKNNHHDCLFLSGLKDPLVSLIDLFYQVNGPSPSLPLGRPQEVSELTDNESVFPPLR